MQRKRYAAKAVARGNLGKFAEGEVRKWLERDNGKYARFAYHRFTDTRAARNFVANNPSDFLVQLPGVTVYLEVKEFQKEALTLAVSDARQMPRMRKFTLAGGVGVFLIYYTTYRKWVAQSVEHMEHKVRGSWSMAGRPLFDTPREAFIALLKDKFDVADLQTTEGG